MGDKERGIEVEEQVGCVFLEKMADLKTLYERAMAVDEAVAGYVSDARQAELLKRRKLLAAQIRKGQGQLKALQAKIAGAEDQLATLNTDVAQARLARGGDNSGTESTEPTPLGARSGQLVIIPSR